MSIEPTLKDIDTNLILTIGKKIQELRKNNRYTLKQLATKSAVAYGTISKIENGEMVPSIVIFYKIAKALNTDLNYFFNNDQNLNDKQYQYFQKDGYKTLHSKDNGLSFRLYGPKINSQLITNITYCTLFNKNSGSGAAELVHEDEELLLCTKGSVKFKAGENEIILKKGDILFIKSNTPHSWQNNSNKESETFMITMNKENQETKLL